jgi:ABC-type multidrug transport system fused ATPase/permease subunit
MWYLSLILSEIKTCLNLKMKENLILFLMLSLFLLSVSSTYCDRLMNPLVMTETNMILLSQDICDYLVKEGSYPINLSELVSFNDELKYCKYDYFAKEQIINRNFNRLFVYILLVVVMIVFLLLKKIKVTSFGFFVVILVFFCVFIFTHTPLLFWENPQLLVSNYYVNKSKPYSTFSGISMEYDFTVEGEFHYEVTKDHNAVLLSPGPDFVSSFSKKQIAELNTKKFINEIISYSPTNGLQSNGDIWIIIPKNIEKKTDLPISGLYGFVKNRE